MVEISRFDHSYYLKYKTNQTKSSNKTTFASRQLGLRQKISINSKLLTKKYEHWPSRSLVIPVPRLLAHHINMSIPFIYLQRLSSCPVMSIGKPLTCQSCREKRLFPVHCHAWHWATFQAEHLGSYLSSFSFQNLKSVCCLVHSWEDMSCTTTSWRSQQGQMLSQACLALPRQSRWHGSAAVGAQGCWGLQPWAGKPSQGRRTLVQMLGCRQLMVGCQRFQEAFAASSELWGS